MQKTPLLLLGLALSFLLQAQPTITTFAPTKGSVGTTVTITGTGFSNNPSGNIVRFGATRAAILTATSTSLTVTVPAGTTYEPLTVTTGGLIASSTVPFNLVFATGGITATAFDAYERIGSGGTFVITDINDDGKPDAARITTNAVSLFKNNSNTGLPLFQTFVDATRKVRYNNPVTKADVDGDGRPDLVVARNDSTAFTVFRNIGTADRPRYDSGNSFRNPPNTYAITAADFDGDGRLDIATSSYDYSAPDSFCVHRNTTANGTIAFSQALRTVAEFTDLKVADLNSDGKPDIIATPYAGFQFTAMRNTSTPGSISFANTSFNKNSSGDLHATIADFDGDGKPDVAFAKYSTSGVTVIRNTSTGGAIAFWQGGGGGAVDLPTPGRPHFIVADDMDGDGRIDLVTSNMTGSSVSVIRNTNAVVGAFSFAAAVSFPVPTYSDPADLATADLDGDSKPEIVLYTTYANSYLNIFRNQIDEPAAVRLCPPVASTTLTANLTGSGYQWQMDSTGSGYAAIAFPHPQLSASGATLHLTGVPSSWYGRKFRCLVDGAYSSEFVLRFQTTYAGPVNGTWETAANWSCGVVPDANTDVVVGYGNVTVNSHVTVRSLRVNEGAKVTVANGKGVEVR